MTATSSLAPAGVPAGPPRSSDARPSQTDLESAADIARALLSCCLRGEARPDSLITPLLGKDSPWLFRIVVEGLCDRFEPGLCDAYADLACDLIGRVEPGLHATDLRARYDRVRRPRPVARDPQRVRKVAILSRVTLGADVAITSVLMDAALRAFPNATIHFAGPRACWELFAGRPRLVHLPVEYGRASDLAQRLGVWPVLQAELADSEFVVVDPDSRLTQLGLLPICGEDRYHFFESRAYGGDGADSVAALSRRWAEEVFAVTGATPFVQPGPTAPVAVRAAVTVSLGVGGNPAKRMGDPFEAALVAGLARQVGSVLVHRGVGAAEAERADRAVAAAGPRARAWDGSMADFARVIADSRLYVGYDSAGGHVAAACGVPAVIIFRGAPSRRFRDRWRPTGPGPVQIITADERHPGDVLAWALQASIDARSGHAGPGPAGGAR